LEKAAPITKRGRAKKKDDGEKSTNLSDPTGNNT